MIGRRINWKLFDSWRQKAQLFVMETDGLTMTATPQCSTPQDSKLLVDGGRSRGRIRPKKATAARIPIAQVQRHSPVVRTKNQPFFF